jgi:hypothetical protein
VKAVLFWALLLLGSAWAGTALWVQFPQARPVAMAAFALLVAGVVWARLGPGWGWSALALSALVIGGWYLSLRPQQNRDWAPDVAHIVQGDIEGDKVTLQNVRAFRWTDAAHATELWETRSYDLSQLTGADMITSVWDSPKIAHLLVSFGFADGRHVVFSVEIRREKGEAFSSIGGFFRQFELSLIAADEADVVKLRTNFRGEEVRLYPLRLTPEQLRAVFLRYVELGNALNEKPRWYNTVTANCTTVVWQLTRVLNPDLPLDRSLLLSGYLPDWLYRMGVLADEGTLEDIRARAVISDRAKALPEGADYSVGIRAGR